MADNKSTAKKASAAKKAPAKKAAPAKPAAVTESDPTPDTAPLEAPTPDTGNEPDDATPDGPPPADHEPEEPSDDVEDDGIGHTIDGSSGAGYDVPAPAEAAERPPATTLVPGEGDSAPIEPPDRQTQALPEQGYDSSSTDNIVAIAGGKTMAGENTVALVNEDGELVDVDDIFNDADPAKTFVVTKTRVFERFTYPRAHTHTERLLFAAGRKVPRWQAEEIKRTIKSHESADEANNTPEESDEQAENA